MSTTATASRDPTTDAGVGQVAMKLEVVTIPVTDINRAKEFYQSIGWRLDADFSNGGEHVVQVTPPGSPCSVHFGTGLTTAKPGSPLGILLIVSDIQAARDELVRRGVEPSEAFHFPGFSRVDRAERLSGPSPDFPSYGTFLSFQDPDGNEWLLQEVTARLPGRIDTGAISFGSAGDLASAFRRAEAAHGEHEKRTGVRDADWPSWYASYMIAEHKGDELPL